MLPSLHSLTLDASTVGNPKRKAIVELRRTQTVPVLETQDEAIAEVRRYGSALQHASPGLRNDKSVVLAAVKTWGGALQYASKQLRNDPEVVLAAVRSWPEALQYASPELQANREIVLAAVMSCANKDPCVSSDSLDDPMDVDDALTMLAQPPPDDPMLVGAAALLSKLPPKLTEILKVDPAWFRVQPRDHS